MSHFLTKESKFEVDITTSLDGMYGEEDLAKWELFKGYFINFGFWERKVIKKAYFTNKDRRESSELLYKKIILSLNVNKGEKILEVGCGQGEGAFLLAKKNCTIYGMDSSKEQIDRCISRHFDEILELKGKIKFFQGLAEDLPLSDDSIDKLFSLEAMQHFSSVSSFLKEAQRVLKFGGKLVVATFLFKKQPSVSDLNEMTTFANGIDNVILVDDLETDLKQNGFNEISITSIGENIWEGFDKWISQTSYSKTWNRKWLQLYKDKIIDYFIVEAFK